METKLSMKRIIRIVTLTAVAGFILASGPRLAAEELYDSLLFGETEADPAAGAATAAAAAAAASQTATSTNLPPKPHWQTSASAGVTLTRGNTKTFLGTLGLLSNGKWDRNEANLGADFTYGEAEDKTIGKNIKNAEQEHAFGQYNHLFSERLFGYARIEGLHDDIADVNYRVTVSPGGGYYFIKNPNMSLRGELGPGFIFQKQSDHVHNYATLRVADRFEFKFKDHAHLWQMLEYLPEVERFKNYIVNAEIGVESQLTKKMSLRTFLNDCYHNVPAFNREKNDAKLVAALAYKF